MLEVVLCYLGFFLRAFAIFFIVSYQFVDVLHEILAVDVLFPMVLRRLAKWIVIILAHEILRTIFLALILTVLNWLAPFPWVVRWTFFDIQAFNRWIFFVPGFALPLVIFHWGVSANMHYLGRSRGSVALVIIGLWMNWLCFLQTVHAFEAPAIGSTFGLNVRRRGG